MAKKKGNQQKSDYKPNIDDLHVPECGYYGLRETMTDEQLEMCESIIHNTVTFVNAKAGTGKTTMAVATAKFLIEHNLADKLVYIASPVEEGTLGYRPGTAEEKAMDYTGALYDALVTIGEFPERAMHPVEGWVEFKTDTFLRGTNMSKVVVIIDEAQNYSRSQLKKTITRCHDDAFLIVIGHDGQIDLKKPETSGFVPMIDLFKELAPAKDLDVGYVELTVNFRGKVSQIADELEI